METMTAAGPRRRFASAKSVLGSAGLGPESARFGPESAGHALGSAVLRLMSTVFGLAPAHC